MQNFFVVSKSLLSYHNKSYGYENDNKNGQKKSVEKCEKTKSEPFKP